MALPEPPPEPAALCLPELHAVLEGKVSQLRPFGAFIQIGQGIDVSELGMGADHSISSYLKHIYGLFGAHGQARSTRTACCTSLRSPRSVSRRCRTTWTLGRRSGVRRATLFLFVFFVIFSHPYKT